MKHFTAFLCLASALVSLAVSTAHAGLRLYASHLLDAGGNEGLVTLATAQAGSLFVAVDLGTGSRLGNVTGGPALAKFDAAGNLGWARALPLNLQRLSAAAMPDGGVVMTGAFSGTINFGGGAMTATDFDVFVVRFDAAGQLAWQHKFGGNLWQYGTAVATDGGGNVVITGYHTVSIDFGGGIIRSNGGEDAFLAKFDAGGGHLWSRGFGFAGSQQGLGIDIGADGRIALAIQFDGASVDFGEGQILNIGSGDVAAAVFDATGNLIYSVHAGSPFAEAARGIALDGHENLFVCGFMTSALDLGGGILTPVADRSTSGFIASYDETGAHRWSLVIPDTVRSSADAVAADSSGNCFVVGSNHGGFAFGLDQVAPSQSLLLAFHPNGYPLDALGLDHPGLLLRMNPARDRFVLGISVSSEINFGGETLVPDDRDVALAEMGVRRPPQVTISRFEAHNLSDGVDVSWSLASDELLGDLWLSRRSSGSPAAEMLYSAPAVDGETSFLDRAATPGSAYAYRLTVVTAAGDEVYSNWASVEIPRAANVLEQNAPNPFNPLTTFAYSLSAPADVAIVIYDTRGAVIARLEQGMQPAGRHTASWGGHNMHGEFVASGVYYYRLDGVPGVGARKMLLLK